MTYSEQELMELHLEQLEREKELMLSSSSLEIQKFQEFCLTYNIEINSQDFDYFQTTGVIAKKTDLLSKVFSEVKKDKDGLFSWKKLKKLLTNSDQMPGYIPTDNFIAMAHPYFRRGMHFTNNFSPRFIDLFWQVNDPKIDAYIALDPDHVRASLDSRLYFEADTWFGAPFDEDIENIPDGISKLRPPLDMESHHNTIFFKEAYCLDIKWSTQGNIKTFQALEFKQPSITIKLNGVIYHPVRYIHAEYDLTKKGFRHFDGAVHHYLPSEYMERRDLDFNLNNKSQTTFKAISKKLFKFNGTFSVEFWVEFSSHFFTGNPLIFEYFSGNYPKHVEEALERIRAKTI